VIDYVVWGPDDIEARVQGDAGCVRYAATINMRFDGRETGTRRYCSRPRTAFVGEPEHQGMRRPDTGRVLRQQPRSAICVGDAKRARLTGRDSTSNPAEMPTAYHGDLELFFEVFGSATDPTLLLINGLGSQCINYDERWCEQFAAQGYRVIRFDNRDAGLSSKLDDRPYALRDMAGDAVAVLDTANAERAHVMGVSMGGMIAQRLAIDHGDGLLSLTSVMSRTGEPEYGQSSPEAHAVLMAKPARTRDEYVDNRIAATRVYGSKPEWIDEPYLRARAAQAFDRCYCPAGVGRQMRAIMSDGDRSDGLRTLTVPTLVMHGDRDTLIDPSGGRRTAELIPGARYVEIEGMGHDYPVAVWDRWVETWTDFVRSVA